MSVMPTVVALLSTHGAFTALPSSSSSTRKHGGSAIGGGLSYLSFVDKHVSPCLCALALAANKVRHIVTLQLSTLAL